MVDEILSRRRDLRLALVLVGATLAWNAVEAVVALAAGWSARSIALVGFGLDSVIEGVAATALLWRVAVDPVLRGVPGAARPAVDPERAETLVLRIVGWTFLALAAYVVIQALWQLGRGTPPVESFVGIVLAAASTLVMPIVAVAKLRVARRLGSRALVAEAKETLACAWLSVALLLGLGLHALVGWWQADPIAALVMVPWLVKEGLEGVRGDECCGEQ